MMEPENSLMETQTEPRSMLVVTDAVLNARLFNHLRRQEWTVEYVASNEEVLLELQKRPFDLILTAECTAAKEDLLLLRKIRKRHPHTRVIILTSESTPDDVLMALRQGAFSYFSTSYTFESLAETIHLAMEKPCWDYGIEVISATPVWVRLLVRCDRGTADRLMQFFMEIVDLPEEEKGQVAFAFREMMMNAMLHGGHFDPSQYIEISYLRARHGVACRIKDPGEGFSLDELYHAAISNPPDDPIRHIPVREASGLPAGGYGILLSRHLVDELVYNEQGNEVLLIKYLNPNLTSRDLQTSKAQRIV